MNKSILISIAFLAFFSGEVLAQKLFYPPAWEAFEADSTIIRGNYSLYDFDTPPLAPVPKGFQPVYITNYCRHGARTYNSNRGYDLWEHILTEGKAADQLTEAGKQLYQAFMDIYPEAFLRGGDLTREGHRQLRRLGMRLYEENKTLFRRHPAIEARSTSTPRVILSMQEFCDGLKTCDPSLEITRICSGQDRFFLNPFSSTNPDRLPKDEDFERGKVSGWNKSYHDLMDNHIDYQAILGRYFKDPAFPLEVGDTTPRDACRLFYNVAADLPCLTGDDRLIGFLTREERFFFWRAENFRFYSVAGRTPVYGGRNWAMMASLLRDIVRKADTDLSGEGVPVRLRFGHDFFLIGLATLLDIDGWNVEEADPEKVDAVFRHYCSPMAMNMQWVFYRNKQGETLVRTTLNGREVLYPIAGFKGPFYPWSALRAYFVSRVLVAEEILSSTR